MSIKKGVLYNYTNLPNFRNKEYKNKLEEIQKAETKTILEKAKEIERLRQECESFRNEVQKRNRKEASAMDKAKDFEGKMENNKKFTKYFN